jgi:hypothetical protein
MTFDDQLRRYFGTATLDEVSPDALEAAIERMRVDLGLETDAGRRFALWAILHSLDAAPDVDQTFRNAQERDAARNFMTLPTRRMNEAQGLFVGGEPLDLHGQVLALGAPGRDLDRMLLLPLRPGHRAIGRVDQLIVQ